MEVLQSYNQNAVLCRDGKGNELVVVGKGIGFGKKKGDQIKEGNVSKLFRFYYTKHEQRIVESISDIPEEILLIAEEITVQSSKMLNEELNPAFLISLASHISYAIERQENGIITNNPLSYELKYIYPNEYKVAEWAYNYVNKEYDLDLDRSEIIFFTLHFVNSLQSTGEYTQVVILSDILNDISEVVLENLDNYLDKENIHYSRFMLHARYMVLRQLEREKDNGFKEDKSEIHMVNDLNKTLVVYFPKANKIALKVVDILKEDHNLSIENSDQMYLMIHIQRLMDEITI